MFIVKGTDPFLRLNNRRRKCAQTPFYKFTRAGIKVVSAHDWLILKVIVFWHPCLPDLDARREGRTMMQLEQKFIQALHALRHHRLHAPQRPIHEVYQSSTINALLEGVYDGDMTYGQLRRHGDFGIGTFNALDGEMIGFDGRFWQITGDSSSFRREVQ